MTDFNTAGTNTIAGHLALNSNTSGYNNTATGYQALYSNTSGINNTATGYQALYLNTTGANNVAIGVGTLAANTTGIGNFAMGTASMAANTTGGNNVAIGSQTLNANTAGVSNVAIGMQAMLKNTVGGNNVAVGIYTLSANTTGSENIAIGNGTMSFNTSGTENTAVGSACLQFNTTGNYNTALGVGAMTENTTGTNNIAAGTNTMWNNTTGSYNCAYGAYALASNLSNNENTAIGASALAATTGGYNTGIGSAALGDVTSGQLNTAIGRFSGRGITTGNFNTVIGALVTSLPAGLSSAIILATGEGTIRADFSNTVPGAWTLAAPLNARMMSYTIATAPSAAAAGAGAFIYLLNGNAGNPGVGISDGNNWRVVPLGSPASSSATTASPSLQPSSTAGSPAGARSQAEVANSAGYQFFSHPNSNPASVTAVTMVEAFLPRFATSSTIPSNGDLNPYGVAFVPEGFPSGGAIAPGDVLVSNFNAKGNLKGTGTTIVKPRLNGAVSSLGRFGTSQADIFFHSSKQIGLTAAFGILRAGYVLVGNIPTRDGTSGTISQGSLQIVDRRGNLIGTLVDSVYLDSPWGLTINDQGSKAQVFVSNVVSGTVSRLDLAVGPSDVSVVHMTEIAMGYARRPDPAALVLGPTGLAYDAAGDVLYVASTADNMIFAVPQAGKASLIVTKGTPVFADPDHLRGPLGLAFAPNGHLLAANGDAVNADPAHPSRISEFTTLGEFVGESNIDPDQNGAFGLATLLSGDPSFNFAAVNGNANSVAVVRTN